jgi:hypothetical protein
MNPRGPLMCGSREKWRICRGRAGRIFASSLPWVLRPSVCSASPFPTQAEPMGGFVLVQEWPGFA